ncbi:MAG: ABC transporter substrate-binding protein [Bacteroidales bacterium]
MIKQILYIILLLFIAVGCKNTGNENRNAGSGSQRISDNVQYAEKFRTEKIGDATLLEVFTPWQNASETSFRYVAASDRTAVPDSVRGHTFIKTPVQRVVIMSTTFIPFLDTLGELHTIRGISGGNNIYDTELYKQYLTGSLREVGHDHNLNYEVLVDLDPDVIFMFGVQSGIVQSIRKLEDIGIPVVLCADYLEPHPLGRSEWLKFFSVFFEKEEMADSLFGDIVKKYNDLVFSASCFTEIPKVMLGLPWKDSWHVAGGRSFAAQLIRDAGGEYIYEDLDNTEAKPYSIESVFMRGQDARIWINPGVAKSRKAILDHDQRFGALSSFREERVFNNIKRLGPGGGNDYWESGVLRPDLILSDLIRIFHHPGVTNDSLHYYLKLN